MYSIKLTKENLSLIQQALEFYLRVGIGQWQSILDHPTFKQILWNFDEDNSYSSKAFANLNDVRDEVFSLNPEIKSRGPNANMGIHNKHVDDSARIAYDLLQIFRHAQWQDNPDRSRWTIDADVMLITEACKDVSCEPLNK